MTEENVEIQESVVEETVDDSELTPEQLKKELTKVRREAAAKRVKNNELEDKAKKYDEYLESQKTELQRLTDEKAALAKENADLKSRGELDKVRAKVATKYKLDAELAAMLFGDEQEMEAKAKLLADRTKGSSTDFYAGRRGTPVEPAANPGQEWFANAWKAADKRTS